MAYPGKLAIYTILSVHKVLNFVCLKLSSPHYSAYYHSSLPLTKEFTGGWGIILNSVKQDISIFTENGLKDKTISENLLKILKKL